MDIQIIVIVISVGFAAAAITMFYNSRFTGRFIRALLNIDALSPEAAMTPDELGIKINPALRNSLRQGSSLSSIVIQTADGRYYIAPEKADMARHKYRDEKASVLYLLLLLLIIIIVTVAMYFLLPDIIDYAKERGNEIFGEGR